MLCPPRVIDIGEIPAAVAVVVYLYRLASQELVGKAEVGHVGAAGWAIHRKEAKARGGDVVEFAVAVGEDFVALLGGRIKRHRVVHTVVGAERHLLAPAIYGTIRGMHQVLRQVVTAGVQDVIEPDHIALDVGIGVLDAATHACLRCVVHDDVEVVAGEELVDK